AISNYKLAEIYGEKGHFLTQLLGIFKMLGQLYEESGNYKQSTYYFRQSIILKDSLYNTEKTAEVQKREIAFQFEQKHLADSLKREEENRIKELEVEQTRLLNEEQLTRQKVYTYSGVGAFLLVLSIAFILFKNNSKQKKLNQIIAEQKSTVEEKNKEITDSI